MSKDNTRLGTLFEGQKFRFLLVGCFNTALDFLLLNILTLTFGMFYVLSNILSVIICMFISYFLNHFFVFRSKERITARSLIAFFLITGFSSLVIQSIIIVTMHVILNTPFSRSLFVIGGLEETQALELNISKAAAVAVGMVWNFVLYKRVVFRKISSSTESNTID